MSEGLASSHTGRPPKRWELLSYGTVRKIIELCSRIYFRLEVEGAHHVPADGPFIVSPVHRGNLDTPVVATITRRRMRFMGKKEMWEWRPAGTFFTAMGGFPVDRGKADREALRTCIAVIEGGEPLVIFPEGSRGTGPDINEIFSGPTIVASRTGAPIVPVGIGGVEASNPVGSRFPKPRKIVVLVGEPIPAPTGTDGGRIAATRSRRGIYSTVRGIGRLIYRGTW